MSTHVLPPPSGFPGWPGTLAVKRAGPPGSGVAFVLFWVVVAAWVVVLVSGTDSLPDDSSLPRFLVAWGVIEAAVLLPSVFPVSRALLRGLPFATPPATRFAAGLGLAVGYLLAWVVPGLLAWAGWRGVELLADQSHGGAVTLVTAVLVLVGLYEFTPWKRETLADCRPPYPALTAVSGPWRNLRRGFRLGLACVGCSAGLLVLLTLVGVFNPIAMVAVLAALLLAKNVPEPRGVQRLVGCAVIGFAVLAAVWPSWLSVY